MPKGLSLLDVVSIMLPGLLPRLLRLMCLQGAITVIVMLLPSNSKLILQTESYGLWYR